MDLALVSVLADTAAAFGVIGSLIFVGFQVRQNSSGQRAAAVQAHMSTFQEVYSPIMDTEEMGKLVFDGLRDPELIEGSQRMRFYVFCSKILRTYQGLHWQWKQGVLDDAIFSSMITFLDDMSVAPGWRHVWSLRRHQYDHDFQDFMDAIFADGRGVPLWPEMPAEEAG